MADWLVGWLAGWMDKWLPGKMDGWLADWMDGCYEKAEIPLQEVGFKQQTTGLECNFGQLQLIDLNVVLPI